MIYNSSPPPAPPALSSPKKTHSMMLARVLVLTCVLVLAGVMVLACVKVLTRHVMVLAPVMSSLRGSHGLSAQRARRKKLRGPKGPRLLVIS